MNPYEVLGVERTAGDGEIKNAFRRRARNTHPDNGGSADEFNRVKQAHLVLSDPARRAKFDETGEIGEDQPDLAEQAAFNEVSAALSQVLMLDQEIADVKAAMLQILHGKKQQVEAQAAPVKRALTRAEKVKSRFRRRKEGENTIARMLEWQIRQWADAGGKLDQQNRVLTRAIEIVNEYDFERPPATMAFPHFGGASTTTAGFYPYR